MTWVDAVAYGLGLYCLRHVPGRDRRAFLWMLSGCLYLAAVGWLLAGVANG